MYFFIQEVYLCILTSPIWHKTQRPKVNPVTSKQLNSRIEHLFRIDVTYSELFRIDVDLESNNYTE